MAGALRPGEWLRGVQAVSSVIEQRYLVIDLDGPNGLALPEGASDRLARALEATITTGALPQATASRPNGVTPTQTTFGADQFVVGSEEHLDHFERIVGEARSDVFVLSTFVASQADERGKDRRERIWRALDQAIDRGVRCHVFYGTSLDEQANNAVAMQELHQRLSKVRRSRGFVLLHRDSVGSHAKVVCRRRRPRRSGRTARVLQLAVVALLIGRGIRRNTGESGGCDGVGHVSCNRLEARDRQPFSGGALVYGFGVAAG